MKEIVVIGLTLTLLLIVGAIIFRTLTFSSIQTKVEKVTLPKIGDQACRNLAEAVKFKTVSYDDETKFDTIPFLSLLQFIDSTYPLVKENLQKEIVGKFNLLYKWKGSANQTKPVVLLSHMDVVPVSPAALADWTQPPFDGVISDGFIWGRGTLDDKIGVIGILEAAELLLSKGFSPKNDIYFAFGYDEEIGGNKGAFLIAKRLKELGVEPTFTLDEGLTVTDGIMPGIESPLALIGNAEKGVATIELTVEIDGGHSSLPRKETAISVLSKALADVHKNPFPTEITGSVEKMFEHIGPEMPFVQKMAFANLWLFKPLVAKQLEALPAGNAMIRTTMAQTVFHSGVKENILPPKAQAMINCRILPGYTTKDLLKYFNSTINDKRIQVKLLNTFYEPSGISSISTKGYKAIEKSIKEALGNPLVAPGLVMASTDSRHYVDISDEVYRFIPLRLRSNDLSRIHGTDERISIENFKEAILFYYQLMQNLND